MDPTTFRTGLDPSGAPIPHGHHPPIRRRLPNRRDGETHKIEAGDIRALATVNFAPDGKPGELFLAGPKPDSMLDYLFADAAVLLSLALQHGVAPEALAKSVSRLGSELPASIIGAAVDLLVRVKEQGA